MRPADRTEEGARKRPHLVLVQPPSAPELPDDPDTAAAVLKLARHLEAVDVRLSLFFQTPGGTPDFQLAAEALIEELIELVDWLTPDPALEGDEPEDDPAESGIADWDGLQEQSL